MSGPAITRGRTFAPHQAALHIDETTVGRTEQSPQSNSRFSFRRIPLVSRLLRRWSKGRGERSQSCPPLSSERPPIPSALAPSIEADSSPLPTLSMVVLSIVRPVYSTRWPWLIDLQTLLGEFLSANVSTPFLLFMVQSMPSFIAADRVTQIWDPGFGQFKGEADVGFWTGILGASPVHQQRQLTHDL